MGPEIADGIRMNNKGECKFMKTNFQMLKELLQTYKPKQKGFINNDEANLVIETLHLKEMDILALRNLRDFTVAFFSNQEKDTMENWDKMSAITYVIDSHIVELGGEV